MVTYATADPTEYWRVGTPDGTDSIIANLLITPQPTFTHDGTISYEFLFRPLAGESHTEHQERHAALLRYGDIQGQYTTGEPMGGSIWYSETHALDGSVLTAIQPPRAKAMDGTARGLWCLVESIEDTTNRSQTRWKLEFEVQYLTDFDEYETYSDVRTALERPGIGLH